MSKTNLSSQAPYLVIVAVVAVVAVVTLVMNESANLQGAPVADGLVVPDPLIVDDSLRVASCFDEDPINDYYRKGYVQIAAKRYFDFCQGDYLREYVCSNSRKEIADQFNCEFGCENGACLRISTYS
ncbi:MAG TPA: hypothetical protein VJI98_00380 [Candidatus Nanoarchaeia archaeon]|nr:hypothetical protein [Candidatus Nanoarchaeia archaeon]